VRKILYSPGYGAGWSTWQYGLPQKFSCEYKPLIEAIEKCENLYGSHEPTKYGGYPDPPLDDDKYAEWLSKMHPAVQSFVKEAREISGKDYVCILGLRDLTVYKVEDDDVVRIDEYDGSESVTVGYNDYF